MSYKAKKFGLKISGFVGVMHVFKPCDSFFLSLIFFLPLSMFWWKTIISIFKTMCESAIPANHCFWPTPGKHGLSLTSFRVEPIKEAELSELSGFLHQKEVELSELSGSPLVRVYQVDYRESTNIFAQRFVFNCERCYKKKTRGKAKNTPSSDASLLSAQGHAFFFDKRLQSE